MDFSFILRHLATGAAIWTPADVEALTKAGVSHIIDCRDDFDDSPLLTGRPEILYCWNGTPDDGQTKPVEWFAKGIAFAMPALASAPGATVTSRPSIYCHCAAGVNRGPSMAYAIMLALGFPPDVAEPMIRLARPQVGLAYKKDAEAAIKELGY